MSHIKDLFHEIKHHLPSTAFATVIGILVVLFIQFVIKKDISDNKIMLYMKGTKEMPMCGFSSTVVNILDVHQVEYKATNVLEDNNIRTELSKLSNWPTIPQLFCNGELIGGCDIAVELHNSGELKELLKK